MNSTDSLKWILRITGTVSLTALIFVAVPFAWMDSIHAALGMGRLPELPVVGYLARSTSAFYALLGGLLWAVSFDLVRYRSVLIYLGVSISLLGLVLLVIDWWEGLPLFWAVIEGPFDIVLGLIIWALSRRIEPKL